MSYADRMIAAVGNLDFADEPVADYANGAFAILAAALAKLPEHKREPFLANIEAGDLRRAVQLFPNACRSRTRDELN